VCGLAMRGLSLSHIAGVSPGTPARAFISTDDDATREILRGLGHLVVDGRG